MLLFCFFLPYVLIRDFGGVTIRNLVLWVYTFFFPTSIFSCVVTFLFFSWSREGGFSRLKNNGTGCSNNCW